MKKHKQLTPETFNLWKDLNSQCEKLNRSAWLLISIRIMNTPDMNSIKSIYYALLWAQGDEST